MDSYIFFLGKKGLVYLKLFSDSCLLNSVGRRAFFPFFGNSMMISI